MEVGYNAELERMVIEQLRQEANKKTWNAEILLRESAKMMETRELKKEVVNLKSDLHHMSNENEVLRRSLDGHRTLLSETALSRQQIKTMMQNNKELKTKTTELESGLRLSKQQVMKLIHINEKMETELHLSNQQVMTLIETNEKLETETNEMKSELRHITLVQRKMSLAVHSEDRRTKQVADRFQLEKKVLRHYLEDRGTELSKAMVSNGRNVKWMMHMMHTIKELKTEITELQSTLCHTSELPVNQERRDPSEALEHKKTLKEHMKDSATLKRENEVMSKLVKDINTWEESDALTLLALGDSSEEIDLQLALSFLQETPLPLEFPLVEVPCEYDSRLIDDQSGTLPVPKDTPILLLELPLVEVSCEYDSRLIEDQSGTLPVPEDTPILLLELPLVEVPCEYDSQLIEDQSNQRKNEENELRIEISENNQLQYIPTTLHDAERNLADIILNTPLEHRESAHVLNIEQNINKAYKECQVVILTKDGNTLFRSVAHQIYGNDDAHELVRKKCMDFIETNADVYATKIEKRKDFKQYVSTLRQNGRHGAHLELEAMCVLYNRPAVVYDLTGTNKSRFIDTPNGAFSQDRPHIRLIYGHEHYDSIVGPDTESFQLKLPSQDECARLIENEERTQNEIDVHLTLPVPEETPLLSLELPLVEVPFSRHIKDQGGNQRKNEKNELRIETPENNQLQYTATRNQRELQLPLQVVHSTPLPPSRPLLPPISRFIANLNTNMDMSA